MSSEFADINTQRVIKEKQHQHTHTHHIEERAVKRLKVKQQYRCIVCAISIEHNENGINCVKRKTITGKIVKVFYQQLKANANKNRNNTKKKMNERKKDC